SDMEAGIRGVLRMYKVQRSPLPINLKYDPAEEPRVIQWDTYFTGWQRDQIRAICAGTEDRGTAIERIREQVLVRHWDYIQRSHEELHNTAAMDVDVLAQSCWFTWRAEQRPADN